MGSYVNTKSPAHVDQPPLLNCAYGGAPGVDSWDAYMSFDFNIQHNLETEIYASSGNHLIKIPKVESVISFSSDTAELPNLKRPKYSSDLTRQVVQARYVRFFCLSVVSTITAILEIGFDIISC
jgi:hypothetical protein